MKSTINANQKNNKINSIKSLFYAMAFITLLSSLTSCTVEEMPTNSLVVNQTSISAKDGDIDPPVNIPPKPTRP